MLFRVSFASLMEHYSCFTDLVSFYLYLRLVSRPVVLNQRKLKYYRVHLFRLVVVSVWRFSNLKNVPIFLFFLRM